jgi:MFS transporter, PPP family, 3-phenylpropionic acid transporter
VRLIVLLFAFNGVSNAVFGPFAPAILVDRGLSPTWLGILGACISILYVGLAGAWGHLADVTLGRGRALSVAFTIAAVLLAAFALPLSLVAVALVYVAYSTVYGLLFPLQDALAVNALRDPGRQYGLVRGVQSGAFALSSLIAGAIWQVTGYGWAIPAFILLAIPSILLAWRIPDIGRAELTTQGRGGAVREALTIQPLLPRALLAIGLANVGVFAGLTFLPLLVVRLGGGSGSIGLVVGITAAIEVVALPGVSRLISRVGPRSVVSFGVAGMAVVYAWFALAPSPEHVIAAAVLYGLSWSAMWAGSVTTVRVLLPPQLQGTGQSLLGVTTGGIAAFVANVGGGLLWAGPGPIAVFGIASACAAVGSVVAWWSLPHGVERAIVASVVAEPEPAAL